MSWRTTTVSSDDELAKILALQAQNRADELTAEEVASQGFVTVRHDLETLRAMHSLAPSVIAKDGDAVVGYALVMPVEARALVPVLEPMFALLEDLPFRGRKLAAQRFYVMGQVCVAKSHRAQGVFDALYAQHRTSYRHRFDTIATEIALRNTRSMRAHARVGFEEIHRYVDETDSWSVVALDLTR